MTDTNKHRYEPFLKINKLSRTHNTKLDKDEILRGVRVITHQERLSISMDDFPVINLFTFH